MANVNEKLDAVLREERKKTFIHFSLTGLILFVLSGAALGTITKSSQRIEVVAISFMQLEANNGSYIKVQFTNPDGVRGMVSVSNGTAISAGDRMICNQLVNYYGVTSYKYIKTL